MIPQLTYLAMTFMGLGIAIVQHGTPKKPSKNNAWLSIIGTAVVMALLYKGGFFAPLLK